MADSGTSSGDQEGFVERRSQHNLREIFDAACKATEPFFDTAQGWGGASLTMYARQALREAFPQLTQQEVAILLSGVTRHHREARAKKT